MFDISVNLTDNRFNADRKLVINRAINNGIHGMLIIGSNIKESIFASEIATENNMHCWSTAGIHPNYAYLWDKNTSHDISTLIKYNNKVMLIGECGLDFYRNFSTVKEQLYVFTAQLELAVQYNIPLFLHCRNAFSNFVNIFKKYFNKVPPSVIHCFSGTKYNLQQCLDMNLFIGISELFFHKKYRISSYKDIVLIPKNKILTETDSPYLLLKDIYTNIYKKYKGRNEPALLINLLKKIALYRKENLEILQQETENNARILLRI